MLTTPHLLCFYKYEYNLFYFLCHFTFNIICYRHHAVLHRPPQDILPHPSLHIRRVGCHRDRGHPRLQRARSEREGQVQQVQGQKPDVRRQGEGGRRALLGKTIQAFDLISRVFINLSPPPCSQHRHIELYHRV